MCSIFSSSLKNVSSNDPDHQDHKNEPENIDSELEVINS